VKPRILRLRSTVSNKGQQRGAASQSPVKYCNSEQKELQVFIRRYRLQRLAPVMERLRVNCLQDLEDLDSQAVHSELLKAGSSPLSSREGALLASGAVRRFREQLRSTHEEIMMRHVTRNHHLVFLSHYKVEAGSDAALLRAEMEEAIRSDPGSPAHGFDVPVFLDSEDLCNLDDLQEHVRCTHNVAILLTKGVFTRPWVLVELVTAVTTGVKVLPVQIIRPGNEFVIPDEAWYNSFLQGDLLDEAGKQVLQDCGVKLEVVEKVIRSIFHRIMVPYSPHRPQSIRMAEVKGLLKQCFVQGARLDDGRQ